MKRKQIRKAQQAAEAERRKRSTYQREQAERSRNDIRSASDSVKIIERKDDWI